MEIVINPPLEDIDWARIVELFLKVDWDKRTILEIRNSFEKASYTCFVYQETQLIGFGRTVDDGRFIAVLADVVVDPGFQKKGIGRMIVDTLRKELKGYNWITLSAAPGMEGFYQKLGWKKQKSAYIFPKDDQQLKEHCE